MLIVAPKGITNCDICGLTFNFSSAVLIDTGITAAELDVENARICESLIVLNVEPRGFFAKNLIMII
jgi:hypothetical protein